MADDDDRPISELPPPRKVNRSGVVIIGATVFVVLFGLGLSLYHGAQKREDAQSSAPPPPRSEPEDDNASVPPAVARAARERQQQLAEQAKGAGQSYLPPVVREEPVEDLSLTLEQPPPPVTQAPRQEVQQPRAPVQPVVARETLEERQRRAAAIANYLAESTVVEAAPVETMRIASVETLKAMEEQRNQGIADQAPIHGQPAAAQPQLPASLKVLGAGDMLYAINDFELNSDSPTAVRATVIGGPLAHSVLLGGFERRGEYLVLAFNRITLPNKQTYTFEGVALDPKENRLAVRTDVDRHTFERWGLFLAGTWLGAAGDAYAQAGTTQTNTTVPGGTSTVTSYPEFDTGRVNRIAIGAVGQAAADQMESRFDRPPTVKLAANTQIGILIMKPPQFPATEQGGAPDGVGAGG